MSLEKSFQERISNLRDHASLLSDACFRFREQLKLNKIINIGSRLRVLICSGRGNNLLFELAKQVGESFRVLVLKNIWTTQTEKYDIKTGLIVHDVIKNELLTKPYPNQPTLPIISLDQKFIKFLVEDDFESWLDNGFLIDWEIPNNHKATPEISRLTPMKLIKCYADKEASHADSEFAKEFGCPVENLAKEYTFNGNKIKIPVVYNYIYQIAMVVGQLSADFASRHERR